MHIHPIQKNIISFLYDLSLCVLLFLSYKSSNLKLLYMKSLRLIISLLFMALVYSCQNDDLDLNTTTDNSLGVTTKGLNNGVKIAILSDTHVMDPSLLIKDGTAFQAYLAKDPKLLEFSSEILQAAVKKIISQKPDLVLICGDLTKDGERISHEEVARILRQLTLNGIKVVITPGNHDVNNPEAARYNKDKSFSVPTIQADKIQSIYAHFGYKDAIARDPNSLSYVSEPIEGLRIIAIDANKYYENTTTSIGSGVIKSTTMTWVKEQLTDAKDKGKSVIGMMHHGLVEHYQGQQLIDPGYVIDNWTTDVNELMNAGLKIIFTGHYHANDITKKSNGTNFIFDVETGSTVSYPFTYRMLTIAGNNYSFAPQTITDYMEPGFTDYANAFFSSYIQAYFRNLLILKGVPGTPPYDFATAFSPYFRDAAKAHFAGDEVLSPSILYQYSEISAVSPDLANVWYSLWTDLGVADNNVSINMATGGTTP